MPPGLEEDVRATGAHVEHRDIDPLADLPRVHRLCLLSTLRCGAQDPAALIDADLDLVDALVAAAGGGLLHVTFCPERDPAGTLPAALAGHGVLGALGHTDADHAMCARALESVLGVESVAVSHWSRTSSTECRRCTTARPARSPPRWVPRREAVVELIADGMHLDGATVQLVFDAVGPAGIALVSDAMSASGLDEGDYTLGGREVQVRGREARLTEGGSLAGGVSTLLDQVRWCVTELGIDLVDAVAAAAFTPARALSLTGVGSLALALAPMSSWWMSSCTRCASCVAAPGSESATSDQYGARLGLAAPVRRASPSRLRGPAPADDPDQLPPTGRTMAAVDLVGGRPT